MRYAVRSLERANTWLVKVEGSKPAFTHDVTRRLEVTERAVADVLVAALRSWAFVCDVVMVE